MTQKELDSLLAKMEKTLRRLSIPIADRIEPTVKVNTRAKRRLGCCRRLPGGGFSIEVSAALLDRPEQLKETLCHELLHTCYGCQNHGERWKAYAARVSGALGLDIRRLAPAEAGEEPLPLRRDTVKYVLECQSCGAQICRCRMSKVVKQPWRYRCKCGGKLKRIQ